MEIGQRGKSEKKYADQRDGRIKIQRTEMDEIIPKEKSRSKLERLLVVGAARFELTTSCSQSRRDTGLRYAPKTGCKERLLLDTSDIR